MKQALDHLSQQWLNPIIDAALEGGKRSFLTKEGSTSYGAAVLTSSGKIYGAGQYSSFNHITNIHAEMASVLVATMAGDPEVAALALVSTAAVDEPPTPCGVCRQFLHEHAQRTGRDILVVFATPDKSVVRWLALSDLLPHSWKPRPLIGHALPAWGVLPSWRPGQTPLEPGDIVQTEAQYLSAVWAAQWQPGLALLRVLHAGLPDATGEAGPYRVSDPFREYAGYVKFLLDTGMSGRFPCPAPAYLVRHEEIQGRVSRVPLRAAGLARQPIDTARFDPLMRLFREAGIEHDDVYLTCLRIVGLAQQTSDYALTVTALPAEVERLRNLLSDALARGFEGLSIDWPTEIQPILRNRTAEELLQEGRFVDVLALPNEGENVRCSIRYVLPARKSPYFSGLQKMCDLQTIAGNVLEAEEACYEPARYKIRVRGGETASLVCLHKVCSLLKEGDRVTLRAVPRNSDDATHVQMSPSEHTIRWDNW